MRNLLSVMFLIGLSSSLSAQHLQIRNLSLGWRVFELDGVGSNPATIGQLMKNPAAYHHYLEGIRYNGFYGGVEVQRVQTFYLTTEIGKPNTAAGFWKSHTLQVGLLATAPSARNMGLNQNDLFPSPNASNAFRYREEVYSFVQKQRFAGVSAGINRRVRLFTDRLHFVTGLHIQGSVAIAHRYEQQFKFREWQVENNQAILSETGGGQLQGFRGKNYFQWQVMVPLGLEAAIYQQRLFLRLEADLGMVESPVRPPRNTPINAPGVGVWLTYRLKH